MTQEYYTGVHGAVTYAGAAFAVAEFDFEITRGIATHARSGKWSDLNVPGKVSCKGKLKRIQVDANLIQAMMNATPTTGETATAHAGLTYPGSGSENITDMTDTTPSSPSRVRLQALTAPITTGGTATLIGTDAGDNPISETIPIGTLAQNSYVESTQVFKTLTHVALAGIVGDGGTLLVQYRAGDSTTVIGEPKSFSLVGAVVDGSNNITITLSNVMFNKAKFNFTDASKILEDDMEFFVKDPDTDIVVSCVNA